MELNGELRLQRVVLDAADPWAKVYLFDVGARVGDWSRAAAEYGAGRSGGLQIHAFEPVPESRKALEDSCAEPIAEKRLIVNAVALSNSSGRASIHIPHATAGTSSLYPEQQTRYSRVLEIETNTIDQYCAEGSIGHVHLIKIDTEGNDFRVIQGAERLLRSGRVDVIQFEYNHRWIDARCYLRDVFDLTEGTDYMVGKVCSKTVEIYVAWHPELERFFETNYAIIHRRLVSKLDCALVRIGEGNAVSAVQVEPNLIAARFGRPNES
jgi:FkbM family methyltransferase